MKTRILIYLVSAGLAALLACGCNDMNSVNQKWYDEGEEIYLGMVDSIKVTPGFKRAEMEWQLNSDPRITHVVISWNDGEDTVELPVERTQTGPMSMSYIVDGLNEDSYTFSFWTKDDSGHTSIPQDEAVSVYGENYAATLRPRTVSTVDKLSTGDMQIVWNDVSSTALAYTIIVYKNAEGDTVTQRVENGESVTTLSGAKTGDTVEIYSVYLPNNGIDEVNSTSRSYTLPRLTREMNKRNFSIVVLSGDNTTSSNGRDLSHIWDGYTQPANPYILHTQTNAPGFNFPHHFTWDIGVLCDLSRFHIWPRTDGNNSYYGHQPRVFQLWVASELKADPSDSDYWGNDEVWEKDWYKVVDASIDTPASNRLATWRAGWEYDIEQLPERVRYFRLIAFENWSGENVINIGEVSIYGDDL